MASYFSHRPVPPSLCLVPECQCPPDSVQDRKTNVSFDFFSFIPYKILSDQLDLLVMSHFFTLLCHHMSSSSVLLHGECCVTLILNHTIPPPELCMCCCFCLKQPFRLRYPLRTSPVLISDVTSGKPSFNPGHWSIRLWRRVGKYFLFHLPASVSFLECWGQRDSEVKSILCGKGCCHYSLLAAPVTDICLPSFIVTVVNCVSVDRIFQFPFPCFRSLQEDCSFWPGWTQEWPLTYLGQ